MLSCNSLRQAQVCMALARASDDPALKQHYEELALAFVQNAGTERDPDRTAARFAVIKPKPATPTGANKLSPIYPRYSLSVPPRNA
jgi:hypothetical protein